VSAHLVPAVRDLFGQHPRAVRLSPEQVAGLLWILCYVPDEDGPPDPFEVGAALEPLDMERAASVAMRFLCSHPRYKARRVGEGRS
jgi:hypothetical protein